MSAREWYGVFLVCIGVMGMAISMPTVLAFLLSMALTYFGYEVMNG